MDYPVQNQGSYAIISLAGEVDLQRSPRAREQILKELDQDRNVLVHMAAVEYIDSSGVASLVEGLRAAKGKKLKFGLVNVSHSAMQVLKLARLDKVFAIHASVDEAVGSLGQ